MSEPRLDGRPIVSRRERGWRLLLAGLAVCACNGEAFAQSRQFVCSEGSQLTVLVEDAETIEATLGDGQPRRLRLQEGSPLTFTSGRVDLRLARNQRSLRITQPGAEDIHCIHPVRSVPDETFDSVEGLEARSWGGIVRSGPGMDYQKLSSLSEGAPITLLERLDVEMNGFPWFRVTYDGSQTGYQWGGIICPVGRTVPGTFQQCD